MHEPLEPQPAHPRAARSAGAGAALVVASALAATLVSVLLDLRVDPAHRDVLDVEAGWLSCLPGLALAVPGAVLLRRRAGHPVAWVLCAGGLFWAVAGVAVSWLAYATAVEPALPGASLAYFVYQRLGASLLLVLPLVLLLYPDGRLPTGRWRAAALLSLASTAALPVAILAIPSRTAQRLTAGDFPQPLLGLDLDPLTLALPEAFWVPAFTVARALAPLSLIVPVAVVVRRTRRAQGDERTRMRWLLWAGVVSLLVMLAVFRLPATASTIGLVVAVAVTGAAVTAGIARPHLVDVDRLLGTTVVYGLLAVCVVVLDVVVVSVARRLLGDALPERDAALITLLVVVAVYSPARDRLSLLVRRTILGQREDPYGVVSTLAERLERSDGTEDQLLAVARTAAEAFRASYVAVEVDRPGGERIRAEHGSRPADVQFLPISYRGEHVGRLVLPRRGSRAALSERDERLLGDVVRQAAAAARSSDLAKALQDSREQIVGAREEERRRLRRDLHDGLGPVLGSVVLRIDAARNIAATDGPRADEVLRAAREDVAGALADVRRLVHDLRPPALDDVGLLEAVRQQADRLGRPGLRIDVDGAGLTDLPAAVEVAAYRIASEALTNVARHSGASSCRVRLVADAGALVVEVADDGVGIAPDAPAGVGLASLRERAAELGGRGEVLCPPGGGTLVRAHLPLTARTDALEPTRA